MSSIPATGRSVLTTGAQGTPGVRAYQTLQSLYSTWCLAAAALPSEVTFFGYKRGDNVPGAGLTSAQTSTRWHTNMRLPAQLPRPSLFIIEGVRLWVPAIATSAAHVPALSDPSFSATASVNSDNFDSIALLNYSCSAHLKIGDREYLEAPMFLCPSNVGYGGAASVLFADGGGAAIGHVAINLPNTIGQGWNLWPFVSRDGTRGPILVAEGQNIMGNLRCAHTTNPTLLDIMFVQMILDGQLTRATQ